MNRICTSCLRFYNDEYSWTLCPHNPLEAGPNVGDYCARHDIIGPCHLCNLASLRLENYTNVEYTQGVFRGQFGVIESYVGLRSGIHTYTVSLDNGMHIVSLQTHLRAYVTTSQKKYMNAKKRKLAAHGGYNRQQARVS